MRRSWRLPAVREVTYGPSQNTVHYLARIDVTDATGADRGDLDADATVNAFSQSMTGYITSRLDADVQTIPNLGQAQDAQQNA